MEWIIGGQMCVTSPQPEVLRDGATVGGRRMLFFLSDSVAFKDRSEMHQNRVANHYMGLVVVLL